MVVMDALLTTVFPGTESARFIADASQRAKKGGVDQKAHQNAMDYDVARAKIHKSQSAAFRHALVQKLDKERVVALDIENRQDSD